MSYEDKNQFGPYAVRSNNIQRYIFPANVCVATFNFCWVTIYTLSSITNYILNNHALSFEKNKLIRPTSTTTRILGRNFPAKTLHQSLIGLYYLFTLTTRSGKDYVRYEQAVKFHWAQMKPDRRACHVTAILQVMWIRTQSLLTYWIFGGD